MKVCATAIKAMLTAALFFASNAYAQPEGSCFEGVDDMQAKEERNVFTLVEGVLSFFATIDKAGFATFEPPGVTPRYEWVFDVNPVFGPDPTAALDAITMEVHDLLFPQSAFTVRAVVPEGGEEGRDYILFFDAVQEGLFGANVNFMSRVCSWDNTLHRIFKCEAVTEALEPGNATQASSLVVAPFQQADETTEYVWQETIKNVFPAEANDAAAACRAEGREVILNSRKEAGQAGLLQIPPAFPLAKFNQPRGRDNTSNGNFIQRVNGTYTVELTKVIDTQEPGEIRRMEGNVTCLVGMGCTQGDIDIRFTP
jgi:hypothetical protein